MDNELLNWGLRIRPSFKIVASVVPKKTVTHTKKNTTKLRNYGQTKASIAPLFQRGAIIRNIDQGR